MMRRALGILALLAAACGRDPEVLPPEGHIVLHVDTDAWVPTSASPHPAERPPLFDTLLVEVFGPGESEPCGSCVHQLALNAEVLEQGGSLAIVSDGTREGIVVRLSMFLAAHRHSVSIDPAVSVQLTAALPPLPDEGGTPVWVFLPTDAVGAPIGSLEAPAPALTESPGPSRARTWPGALPVDCAEPPRGGEVCVPGGAFWMGNRRAEESTLDPQPTGRRLVTLSPFYMEVSEVTAGEIRSAKPNLNQYIAPWSGDEDGDSLDDWCSYAITADAERDALPMNCIAWQGASAYCESRKATLPSEAQYEYVAGALEGRDFIWGSDVPACEDAVWGRATGINVVSSGAKVACADTLAPGDIGGPLSLPADATPQTVTAPRARDVLVLPTGAVFDLAGNVGEWVRDWFQPSDSACWRSDAGNVFHDPVCEEPSSYRSFRGGYHSGGATTTLAAERNANPPANAVNEVGFRCVRPAEPAAP